jgi:hypothetical protein
MTNTAQTVQTCIAKCASAKDGRGRWRACKECVDKLIGAGATAAIAADTASAARRIGELLATYPAARRKAGA